MVGRFVDTLQPVRAYELADTVCGSHVRSWFRRLDAIFSNLAIGNKITVVTTVAQTVGLRSPDHSRHPPDRDFT